MTVEYILYVQNGKERIENMEERDCKHCKNYKWVEEEIHGGRQIGGYWSCCKWDCKFEKRESEVFYNGKKNEDE